ncbi:PHP domain-containing protein [Methylacidimicrobium sp. B4]|uniref:PHP domain-containing protein n=1 Tax=Methylacidimicrobium sp. B4 TaxID=2796139 RepID=UPI001A8FC6D7|nr:PHP domain-containing protein [Methylacidimicrobium sp. B4]QSR84340.1 PHP domain-containing protein [Methylacidimicrobium sp. B4]
MQIRADLHCHSHFSSDGVSPPEELIRVARQKGLNAIALTDHNSCAGIDYLESQGLLRADGRPVDGFLVIPGQEISTREGHLLALGVRLPDLHGIAASDAASLIRNQGGFSIAPHPFDYFRAGIRSRTLDTLSLDAIEVFNAAATLRRSNRQAFRYAKERGLPMVAASDAHEAEAVGTAYVILEAEEFSVAGVFAALRQKSSRLEEHYIKAQEALRKTWHNVFRFHHHRVSATSGRGE